MGELSNMIHVGASLTRLFMRCVHRSAAARWPHGVVDSSPAPMGDECDEIGQWTKIPRPATGVVILGSTRVSAGVPVSDADYLAVLRDPFGYHRSMGRIDGVLAAVKRLGYQDVVYLDWDQVIECPMWVPPGSTGVQPNQNVFGLYCPNFSENWTYLDGTPALGTPLSTLVKVIKAAKRASARLVEIRTSSNIVITDDSTSVNPDIVITDNSTPDNPNIVTSA